MSCNSPSTACYKFQLIIDGCNGPIRFREHCLRKVEIGETSKDLAATSDEPPSCSSDASTEVNDDDATILSLLRPETIMVTPQKSKTKKSKKSTKGKRKSNSKPQSAGNFEAAENVQESPNRLDMIPLLQKLLISSSSRSRGNESELFDSIVVIFDGVSITKRPPVQVDKQSENGIIEKETMDEEITMGRSWNISCKSSNVSTATKMRKLNGLNGIRGSLAIQITGLYDEADNVIVEHIQECRSQKLDRESPADPLSPSSESYSDTARIQVMRRTERGAGKNRRLFQPLGLLRPESVACVFDFVVSVPTYSGQHGENVGVVDKQTFHSSPFRKLALDGEQTLRSIRRQNPGNVFVVIDEASEIPRDADNTVDHTIVLPIVVTDDVFLRQRIVHEEGFVMTFHQLWLLLMDVN